MINVTKTFLPPIEEYVAQLERVWKSAWLTNRGELIQELESRLANYLDVTNLLIVNNGTTALQLGIRGLELKGEVITTPFSYVATASSLVWEYCTPRFVDIEFGTLTVDADIIEASITPETSGILVTHVFGNPCDVENIEEIGRQNELSVIYDAAHCFGVNYQGKSILDWGDVSTLSFHATKLFHTGEGGGIICRDGDLMKEIAYLHNFGHEGQESFHGLGINGKLSELSAAMGLAVLPYIPRIIERRKKVVDQYDASLTGSRLIGLSIRPGTDWNYSYYPVLFSSEDALKLCLSRLADIRIFPRRYFYPALNTLPYLTRKESCPIAEDVSRRIVCLPLFDSLSSDDVEKICELILEVEH